MAEDPSISVREFGASFKGFLQQVANHAPQEDSVFRQKLLEHFGTDPIELPVLSQTLDISDRPNLQLAIDDLIASKPESVNLLGVLVPYDHMEINLARLAAPAKSGLWGDTGPTSGPVQFVSVASGNNEDSISCVRRGLYLWHLGDQRIALLLGDSGYAGIEVRLRIEVMAANRTVAEQLIETIRATMRSKNVYRGRTISLSCKPPMESIEVSFHSVPVVERSQIVLPNGLLDRIERQTVRFSDHATKLRAAGRHLKRGILLHGPPGTGKTLTAMYLIARMPERTTLLLAGRDYGLIQQSVAMARALQPATIILEDVDLVAEDRTRQDGGCNSILFELLNHMDGLNEDCDVLFLLTTNRAEVLEPALASRPGRIDLAVEFPLPDEDGRRKLLDLYSHGLNLKQSDIDEIVPRMEGATPAFIREVLRKASLFAAEHGDASKITRENLDDAMHELTVYGGKLTRKILGFRQFES